MTTTTVSQETTDELNRALARMMPRDPRMQQWECEDGWIVGYTTERFGTGSDPFDLTPHGGPSGTGKFGFFVYKPERVKGEVQSWKLTRHRYLAKRKDAKRLAVIAYWQHCPKRRAKTEARGYRLNERTGEWERAAVSDRT